MLDEREERPEPDAGLDELIAAGAAKPAEGDLLTTIAEAGGPTNGPSLSDRLEALRAHER